MIVSQRLALRRKYLLRCPQCKHVVPNALICIWCGAWISEIKRIVVKRIKKKRGRKKKHADAREEFK